MATDSSILAWEIPWTEEPGGLQPLGSETWTRPSDLAPESRKRVQRGPWRHDRALRLRLAALSLTQCRRQHAGVASLGVQGRFTRLLSSHRESGCQREFMMLCASPNELGAEY